MEIINEFQTDLEFDDYLEEDNFSEDFSSDEIERERENSNEESDVLENTSEDNFENLEQENLENFESENKEDFETTSSEKENPENRNEELNSSENSLSKIDMNKLDKKSREILEETDESDYKFKLQDFEGPIDLIVHLIKISKVDIRDIFISNITEQYMEMMQEIETIDVEKASEFISMAATLLEIKSKHLLPKPEIIDEDDTSEEDLYRMIEEYTLIKDEMEKLAKIENVNRFFKLPDSSVGEFRYELPENLSVDAMIRAFTNLMQKVSIKAEAVQEKKIEKDKFTVSQKLAQIKDMLLEKSEFMFEELFEEEFTRSEIINTFLALLELLKRQYIMVEQVGLFDQIKIIRNENLEARFTEEDFASEYDGEN